RTSAKPASSRKSAPVGSKAKPNARVSARNVRKPARTRGAAPAPAFPQAVRESARDRILFRMVRARAAVMAAIQGMSAAAAERPLGEGKWSTRETILHLVNRDQVRLRDMEAAL